MTKRTSQFEKILGGNGDRGKNPRTQNTGRERLARSTRCLVLWSVLFGRHRQARMEIIYIKPPASRYWPGTKGAAGRKTRWLAGWLNRAHCRKWQGKYSSNRHLRMTKDNMYKPVYPELKVPLRRNKREKEI